MLSGKNILLGITGSIAAYKSPDIARRLKEEGANVKAVMTEAACRFITPYTLEAVTANPVHTDLFKDPFSHINLPKETDLFIIAPATANTINRFACGLADDLLGCIKLAYEGKVLMAPAMNYRMFRNPLVTKNINELKRSGVEFTGPVSGALACGEEGVGRMVEVPVIIEAAISALCKKDLAGQKILVTAGPTIEPIDPVRYISNRSSGRMGYAVARAAARRGAEVTLVSGPTSLTQPDVGSFIAVRTASEMEAAVMKHAAKASSVIMAAAVADFSPASVSKKKQEKESISTLTLKKNPDILRKLGSISGSRVLVGFAAETGNDPARAKRKLKEKDLDIIVFNDVTQKGAGFDVETNIVTIIDRKGHAAEYPIMKKIEVADAILDKLVELLPRKKK